MGETCKSQPMPFWLAHTWGTLTLSGDAQQLLSGSAPELCLRSPAQPWHGLSPLPPHAASRSYAAAPSLAPRWLEKKKGQKRTNFWAGLIPGSRQVKRNVLLHPGFTTADWGPIAEDFKILLGDTDSTVSPRRDLFLFPPQNWFYFRLSQYEIRISAAISGDTDS